MTNAFSVRGPSSGISSDDRTLERAPSAPIAYAASNRRPLSAMTVTLLAVVSTPATGVSQTNSTPAATAASWSTCSVTTCGRLVAAGSTSALGGGYVRA